MTSRHGRWLVVVIVGLLVGPSVADASVIRSIADGASPGGSWSLGSLSGEPYSPGDNPVPASNLNNATFSVNVTKLFTPIGASVLVDDYNNFVGSGIDGPHEFLITLNVTNSLSTPHPISNFVVQILSLADYNLLPVPNIPPNLGALQLDPAITPGLQFDHTATVGDQNPLPNETTSFIPKLPYSGDGSWTQLSLTYGGQQGGGGQIMPGQTATVTFALDLPDFSPGGSPALGEFAIMLTANPEPTSLLLGAVGLLGGVVMTRRRKKKLTQDA